MFYVESESELKQLEEHRLIPDWNAKVHPLTFTEKPLELLYQTDFTLATYRGKRLKDLVGVYAGIDYEKNVDEYARKKNQ